MRIAMIGQKGVILGEKGGGIERHVHELSKRLVALGHEVTVYARARYIEKPETEIDGIRVVYLPTVYRKNFEAIVHTLVSTLHALFQPYDIIHYHGVGPATLSFIPRIGKPRCRVVATFHSQDRFHAKWSLLARLYLFFGEWAACWFPHATIAVSHVIQVYARKHYHRQVVYIPNGAETKTVHGKGELKRFGLVAGGYVLNVSRLIPHKGQHHLIRAYQKLAAERKLDKKLVLVGAPAYTDVYLDELKNLADGNPDILFLGYQSGEALEQLFAHAYLYCQPSESEGLAVTVLEAMSYGTAVLVSDIKENLEVVHKTCFTFRNKDADDLAEKLASAFDYPDAVAAAGQEAQDVIRRHFTWDTVAEHTEELYRTIRH